MYIYNIYIYTCKIYKYIHSCFNNNNNNYSNKNNNNNNNDNNNNKNNSNNLNFISFLFTCKILVTKCITSRSKYVSLNSSGTVANHT